MIIANISGSLPQQLGQFAFGVQCAQRLGTTLKLDLTGPSALLESFTLAAPIATAKEIKGAKLVKESGALFDAALYEGIADGAYLKGQWNDYRYSAQALPAIIAALGLQHALSDDARGLLEAIHACPSVSLDLRAKMPSIYFEDAIAEMRERVGNPHFFVFCDDAAAARALPGLEGACTIVAPASKLNDAEALLLMSSCHHHIVTYAGASEWAARLDPKGKGLVIAPQHVFATGPGVQQPVWPPHWMVFPTRQPGSRDPLTFQGGGTSSGRRMKVGITNFYERTTVDGFLFKNVQTTNGHNLLKPFVDLYEYSRANGIDFYTLDQVASMDELDAVVFMDRPRPESPLPNAALAAPHLVKILIIYECPLVKPDGWDTSFHPQFDYVFTWGDDLVDGLRYIKNNFVTDLALPYDFEVLKSSFRQRKLATLINSAVLLDTPNNFPTELYTHRIRTIRWFEANAPQDFDLYGMGWNVEQFPSYKGKVRDKLAALSHYRFCICYENAMSYPGYITEKIQDCLLAGVVPLYGGAPNIARWIPADCYIDIGQFQSYEALHQHLATMDEATHSGYLDRIHRFFTQGGAYPFSSECFAATLTQYLAWGVQSRRGEVPELAQRLGVNGNAATHNLVQDKQTLALTLVPKMVQVGGPVALRAELANLKRDDLIISVAYGPEMPVFLRGRALWQYFASHFPHIKVVFFRGDEQLPRGETRVEGNGEVVIGLGQELGHDHSQANYAQSGVWSARENERTVYRQVALYDYLLRKYDHPFHLYATTVTSVVDVRALAALMDVVPRARCYAGMLGTLQHPPYQGTGMVHGANTLVSRDVMELMRSRYVPGHEYTKQPNDHWQGLIMPDVERTALPLFSFNGAHDTGDDMGDVTRLVSRLVQDGHYHFRVKTTSEADGRGKREDVDPWIMLAAMQAILSTPVAPEAVLRLQQRFAQACDPANKVARDFPVDDSETVHFYR
ncbi:MAG: glycosyltransferase family 10 [Pseudomonadota bacterium]